MSSGKNEGLLDGIVVQLRRFEVSSTVLQPLTAAFEKNFNDAGSLLVFPQQNLHLIALATTHASGTLARFLINSLQRYLVPELRDEGSLETLTQVAVSAISTGFEGYEDELRSNLLGHPTYRAVTKLIVSGVARAAWTAFECLTGDLWVALLNSRPRGLVGRALKALEHDKKGDQLGGVQGKKVSVELLYEHAFDLRDCMGTILKRQADLTSLENIAKAYKGIFPKEKGVLDPLDSGDIKLLEACRHVIVHRAGFIDQEFVNTTHTLGFPARVGEPLALAGAIVSRLLNSVGDAGGQLLAFADAWLLANPD